MEVFDYREELILSLSSARKLAAQSIRSAQLKYKEHYEGSSFWVIGCWLGFSGKKVGDKGNSPNDPDVTVVPVYFPEKGSIQFHQTRVNPCPGKLPAGFYWYRLQ